MTAAQVINVIVILLFPIVFSLAWVLFNLILQRMPQQQRSALEQFAKMAVQKVEQQYTSNPAKKALAEQFVTEAFRSFRLPIPDHSAVDLAIEAAVYEINMFANSTSSTDATGSTETKQ